MFGVAGPRATPAAREPVRAVHAALAELLAEVVGLDARAGVVADLPQVLTWLVVVLVASRSLQLGLDLTVILRPRPHVAFLFLARQTPHPLAGEGVAREELGVLVDLVAGLGADQFRQGAVVVAEQGVEHGKVRDL